MERGAWCGLAVSSSGVCLAAGLQGELDGGGKKFCGQGVGGRGGRDEAGGGVKLGQQGWEVCGWVVDEV